MTLVDDLVRDGLAAAAAPDPVAALSDLLRNVVQWPEPLRANLPETGGDETLLHASDALTVYHIKLSPGLLYPPHTHEMPAIIGFYAGCETNLFYAPSPEGGLRQTARRSFPAPDVVALDRQVIHAITNDGPGKSRAIHFYLGNLIAQPRHLWDPATGARLAFDNDAYMRFAVSAGTGAATAGE